MTPKQVPEGQRLGLEPDQLDVSDPGPALFVPPSAGPIPLPLSILPQQPGNPGQRRWIPRRGKDVASLQIPGPAAHGAGSEADLIAREIEGELPLRRGRLVHAGQARKRLHCPEGRNGDCLSPGTSCGSAERQSRCQKEPEGGSGGGAQPITSGSCSGPLHRRSALGVASSSRVPKVCK